MGLKGTFSSLLLVVICFAGAPASASPICEPGYICYCTSPIVIDVGGKGILLTDALHGVSFDIAGNGKPVQIAWTQAGARNAWLALDRNDNGTIDSGKELFGNFTPQPECKQPNGFLALAVYDKPESQGNGDGVIDSSDAVYYSLRLWIDSNHNGTSEGEELYTLPELGVASISLDFKDSAKRDRYGNLFRYRARVNQHVQDSPVGHFAYDVYLSTRREAVAGTTGNNPRVIDGAVTPEAIPTEIVYNFFLRAASCTPLDPDLFKQKCEMVQKAVGLDPEDESKIAPHLEGLRDELLAMDSEIVRARRGTDAESISRRSTLETSRRSLVEQKILTLKHKLSSEGRQRFDAYIELRKRKIKFIPNVAKEEAAPGSQGGR